MHYAVLKGTSFPLFKINHFKYNSFKCDVSYGTRSFFELAKETKSTLFMFEGLCDSTIKPIAESVQFFNLTLVIKFIF